MWIDHQNFFKISKTTFFVDSAKYNVIFYSFYNQIPNAKNIIKNDVIFSGNGKKRRLQFSKKNPEDLSTTFEDSLEKWQKKNAKNYTKNTYIIIYVLLFSLFSNLCSPTGNFCSPMGKFCSPMDSLGNFSV